MHQQMAVGDGLAKRHHRLSRIEFASKQNRQQFGGETRLDTMLLNLQQAVFVVTDQLPQPFAHPVKREIMRGKNEGFRRRVEELVVRFHPYEQRVRLRFRGVDADVRRDDREDLISGDQDAEALAMQTGVFRRMACAHDNLPIVISDRQYVAVFQAVKAQGEGR